MSFSNVSMVVLTGNASALFTSSVAYTLTTASYPEAISQVELSTAKGVWVGQTFYPSTAILSLSIS